MQLRRLAAVVALLASARAGADSKVDVAAQYFTETGTQALHVIHPQVSGLIEAHKVIAFRLGYDVDIVTGATPRTYAAGADVVTAATRFSDARHAAHAGVQLRLGPTALDATYLFASENDYRSHVIDTAAKVDLWGKNTTFRLGYAHNFDSVCNADNRGAMPLDRRPLSTSQGCFTGASGLTTEALAIDSYYAAWSQVLSPIMLSDLSASLQVLDGFQSNPYRRVRLFGGAVDAQESHPTLRQRFALQARMFIAVKKLHAALGVTGRFYWDTWNIKAGNVEVSWEQYLGQRFLFRFRGRFYQQSRAIFYRDAGEALSYEAVGPVGQYFSGDREMSPFRNWLWGAKVAYVKSADERGRIARVFDQLELNLKIDLMIYEPLTPLPPNVARTREGIDAAIMHLGLTLRW